MSITNNYPSPPVIRGMAKCLCDNDVDLIHVSDPVRVVATLIKAGWPVKLINENLEEAMKMAAIRQFNERKRT
jgi:hypothetical protein